MICREIRSMPACISCYYCFLKNMVLQIFHKTEINGVFTNINSVKEIKKPLKKLSKFRSEILIEEMIQDQIAEMIIGIKIDNQFGPVIIIGSIIKKTA